MMQSTSVNQAMAKYRILVVDDEPMVTEVVERYLQRDGFEVSTADDGDKAIALAGSWAPDLVVLDLMLPGKDGLEVCRALRKDGAFGSAGAALRDSTTKLSGNMAASKAAAIKNSDAPALLLFILILSLQRASWLTMRPSMITAVTCEAYSNGSPSNSATSPSFPGSSEPTRPAIPSIRAAAVLLPAVSWSTRRI